MRPKIEIDMDFVFYLLISVAAIGILGGGIALLAKGGETAKTQPGTGRRRGPREKTALLREATRRLEANDRDWEALLIVADLAYEDGNHLDSFKHYQTLAPLAGANPGIDPLLVNLRLGHSAMKLKNPLEAYRAFLAARSLDERSFEANFNLGLIEYAGKRYAKAAGFLTTAHGQSADHPATNRYLGTSLFLLKMYPEAVRALEKALDFEPGARQTQYFLARSYHCLNQNEPALKIFLQLRQDPEVGAMSCLFAGTIHARAKRFRQAIEDFEIGLRHSAAASVLQELKYRLAAACLSEGELGRAIKLWREMAEFNPGYKDVEKRLKEHQELNKNRNPRKHGPTGADACVPAPTARKPNASWRPG